MTGWQRAARRIRVPLGFLVAAVFVLLARPSGRSLAWSLLPVAAGLAVRGYASGYVKKNAELTVTGPYAWTRNPLYLGSMLIAFGFAAAARSWALAGVLAALFASVYWPVIRGEELFLRERFPTWVEYAGRVPRLLPWRVPARAASARGRFDPTLYRKHREYQAALGAAALYGLLLLKLRV